MNDICTYTIQIHGQGSGAELNALSPIHMTVTQAGPDATLLAISTDQSGLLGLLSFLHGRGLVILAICRAEVMKGA